MRFKYDSYEKLYPREEIQAPDQIESAVEGFTPTADAVQQAQAPKQDIAPEHIPAQVDTPIIPQPEPIPGTEGAADGNIDNNQPDN